MEEEELTVIFLKSPSSVIEWARDEKGVEEI